MLVAAAVLAAPLSVQGPLLVKVDRARYAPGQTVNISVEAPAGDAIELVAFHDGKPIDRIRPTQDRDGARRFSWQPPRHDGRGYLLVARTRDGRSAGAAVDVSSRWTLYPRYGYLAHFGPELASGADARIGALAEFGINGLQFYDWQWRHHDPLAPTPEWRDIANRPTSGETVRSFIQAGKTRGMASMNYNLAFGAYAGYERDGVSAEWALFDDAERKRPYGHGLPKDWATPLIHLFNPASKGWQDYILPRMRRANETFGFDGWHIDQLGNAGTKYTYTGQPLTLNGLYDEFLVRADREVPGTLIFNNVGGYAIEAALRAPTDVMYAEAWEGDGQRTYNDLRLLIDRMRSTGKPAIVAAYMHKKQHEKRGEFNNPAVLLTDATIFASGASHVELGDDLQMLSHEYFPIHNLRPSPPLLQSLQSYYRFLTAYQELLRGPDVRPAEIPVTIDGQPVSTDGRPGTIWAITRKRGDRTVVHLINLLNAKTANWRDDDMVQPEPVPVTGLKVRVPGGRKLSYWATPDDGLGAPRDGNSAPELRTWTMLVLD